jgi:hypothetical protein
MSFDHESWLRKQGARITGQHTLRRASAPGYMNYWASDQEDGRIDRMAEHLNTTEERVYHVEMNEHTIERFERFESTVKNALDFANRHNDRRRTGYSGYGPNDVSDYMLENKERHLELLKENSMYQDAWKEFQSIRALLGETPHWP